MINYWSFNSDIKDVIGGAHLLNDINAGLTTDRFGRPISALDLNLGCYKIPNGNFFLTGQFTITVWIKLRDYGNYPCIVTFSGVNYLDLIFFGFNAASSRPEFSIYYGNTLIANSVSPLAIPLNEWTYLAITFDQNFNYLLYVNANLIKSANSNQSLKNITRTLNYVGRGWYPNRPDLNGTIDELKMFNRALSQQEIQIEMNNNIN